MTSMMDDFAVRKLDLGRVASQTFTVLGRQPVTIFGLALLLGGLPAALNLYYASQALVGGGAAALTQFTTFGYWLRIIAQLFVGAFLGASLFYVAFSEVSGRKATFGEIVTNGAKLFLPLFAVNFMSAVAIVIGCFLLIVPGLMLAVAWCVAGPALVAERTGITQVFGRSAELTRGNRWRIFGLVLIFLVVVAIIQGVVSAIFGVAGGVGALLSPARLIISGVIAIFTTAITYTGLAVLYANLRELKEGLGHESLAAVFD
ncbi:MAG: hypothetical protein E7812_19115 [Phenylobacterium sp.]|nr:MAG: hypothetical protein E7812_19115 [Phenylobacterium sp.]